MSRARIFLAFIMIDLVIVGACVWSAFQRIPVRQFLIPAIALFAVNGLWLLWMTVKHTPPRQ